MPSRDALKPREIYVRNLTEEIYKKLNGVEVFTSQHYYQTLNLLGNLTVTLVNLYIGKTFKKEKCTAIKQNYLKWITKKFE